MISSTVRPMRKRLTVLALTFACALPSAAQTTIGAVQTTSVGPLTRATAGFQSFGQSFTVPTLAPRLSSFSLSFSNFFNGGALTFDAYLYAFDAANRRIAGSALWSALNIAGSANDFAFDTKTFATGSLTLSPSSTYLFLITTSNQSAVPADAANLVGANDVDGYAGGSFWMASNGASTGALFEAGAFSAADGVTDAHFSAVFLADAQVVPEPTTFMLTGAGLLTLMLLFVRIRERSPNLTHSGTSAAAPQAPPLAAPRHRPPPETPAASWPFRRRAAYRSQSDRRLRAS